MEDLAQRIADFEPLKEGRWLVAVSGGGDSVALLRLMVEAGMKERMVVGNFNHGWGAFGAESEEFVVEMGIGLELDVVVGEGNGKAEANAEAVAREERQAWFVAVCQQWKLAGVVLAHTQDDVVEGFLMRAGKGSGLTGLAGMRAISEVEGVKIARPLLGVSREELRNYLREHGFAWMEDPDNEAGGSQRARVRALLPELEVVGVTRQGVAASVMALAAAEEALEGIVGAFPLEMKSGGRTAVVRRQTEIPAVELGVRLLGRMMRELGEEGMLVRRSKRVALWERICSEEAGVATLGGCKFEWDAQEVRAQNE